MYSAVVSLSLILSVVAVLPYEHKKDADVGG